MYVNYKNSSTAANRYFESKKASRSSQSSEYSSIMSQSHGNLNYRLSSVLQNDATRLLNNKMALSRNIQASKVPSSIV